MPATLHLTGTGVNAVGGSSHGPDLDGGGGGNFVELNEADVCCGSAGSYNLTEPEMAARLQQRKIKNILATGAEIVVTTNPGCLLQIQAGLKKANPKIQVLHIADFLAQQN